MAGNTFISIPPNISDPVSLKRFLGLLVEKLDIAFGNRGTSPFANTDVISSEIKTINDLIVAINEAVLLYCKLDGSTDFTGIVSYDTNKVFTADTNLIDKKYVDTKATTLTNYVNDNFEPIIETKGTAFNVDFGTTTGTVTEGGTTTNNPLQDPISSLNQTISSTYTQSEVQAISSKVDAILATLRLANIITT